jgi:transposase
LYSDVGRPSIAPERLLRAWLLQVFYSIRSERLLMEELDYNLLFRWFVGLSMDDEVWNHAVFSKNRERLLNESVAQSFFRRVKQHAYPYMSDEHFSIDGTLIEAWASQKSFQRKDSAGDGPTGGGENFRGEKRCNDTHESKTDPEARLYRKSNGGESKLAYLGHVMTENRNGLVVEVEATQATGTAERTAALKMARKIPGAHRVTVGMDRNYDAREFIAVLREFGVTPHVAQKKHSAIDGRTTRHESWFRSQFCRKRIEQVFGWMKQTGPMRKIKLRGLRKVRWWFAFAGAAYNLYRLPKLQALSA